MLNVYKYVLSVCYVYVRGIEMFVNTGLWVAPHVKIQISDHYSNVALEWDRC